MSREKVEKKLQKMFRPKEVAEIVGVTEQTLAIWRSGGYGPAYVKLGRRSVTYLESSIAEWIESRVIRRASEAIERNIR